MGLSQEHQARDESRRGAAQVERGFSAAFELVATPALLGLIGWFLDQRLGSGPFLMIGFAAFTACYLIWKLVYRYNTEMARLESQLITDRTTPSWRDPSSDARADS